MVATYERFLLGYRLPTEQQLAEVRVRSAVLWGVWQQHACMRPHATHMLRTLLPTHVTLQGSAAAPSNNSSNSTSTPCVLGRSFTHAAHQGPVRCLDAGGPWLVSGGQDDQLHIYDVKVCLCAGLCV